MSKVLVTGSAGFIGFFVCKKFLDKGFDVVGIDNLNSYYDVNLKKSRLRILKKNGNFYNYEESLQKKGFLKKLFSKNRFKYIIHLAAQAGVRYSIENPRTYLENNYLATFELLDNIKLNPPDHFLVASTSSAYGDSTNFPTSENQKADNQISFYAATKKGIENMCHSYSHTYRIPTTTFRFFTVYGPWGRPDMALFKFTKSILENKPIDVYNYGKLSRDFTYIDDLVHSIYLLKDCIPSIIEQEKKIAADSLSKVAQYRLVNIGNAAPEKLTDFIGAIEKELNQKATLKLLPLPKGDVSATWADTSLLKNLTGFTPSTSITVGIKNFVEWYRDYYKI